MQNTDSASSASTTSPNLSRFAQSLAGATPMPATTSANQPTAPAPAKKSFLQKRWKAILGVLVVLALLISIPATIGFYTYGVVKNIEAQAQIVATSGRAAFGLFKGQNLPGAEAELKKTAEELQKLKTEYQRLAFYKSIPFASAYYNDGEHGLNAAEAGMKAGLTGIASIAPYADVLGFTGEGSFEGGTAENRVKLILDTLTKVTPQLDSISADLAVAQSELNQIDPNRYPEQVRGIAVRSKIEEGKGLLNNAATLLADYRPIIENLPEIAGANGRKKYLVLFQNDNELRPTGGFLTAYSVIFIENGVVTPEKSDDIYELDKKFSKKIAIPPALGRYLTTEKYFHLRDMNTSPDFKLSMDQFYENYKNVPGEPDNIDGIIAVDTHVLNSLIKIVGPIQIAGYGTFSAENDPACDCPQIIHALSEIITRPTPYLRQDRKGILAPLMQGVLGRIYQSPRTFMADLFQVGLDSIDGRHVQMYFFDPKLQTAAESINAAGRMAAKEGVQDFLAIVNANLGGAKSNLFVTYSATQTVSAPQDGKITKTVEITYVNPRKADNCNLEAGLLCLNSTLRDWTRIYLPKGSTLIEAQGFNAEPKQYEEAGFAVIDGFFILEPKSQAKLKLTYTVPYTAKDYQVKIWKQGGTNPIEHLMDVNGGEEKVVVNKDTVFTTSF